MGGLGWIRVIEGLATAGKYFTYADVALNTAMTGVDIAEYVAPGSSCAGWGVRDLVVQATDQGKAYDGLLHSMNELSTDLDNLQQAGDSLRMLANHVYDNWKTVSEVSQKLSHNAIELNSSAPIAEQWINDLETLEMGMNSVKNLKQITDQMNIPAFQMVVGTIATAGLIGGVAYDRYQEKQKLKQQQQQEQAGRPRSNAVVSNSARSRYWERTKAVGKAAFAVGSFAMAIWQVVQLVNKCESLQGKLKTMIGTYSDSPCMKDLIYGCRDDAKGSNSIDQDTEYGTDQPIPVATLVQKYGYDQARFDALNKYLLKTLPKDDHGETANFSDESSQQLVMVGLTRIKVWYEYDISSCVDDLDNMYQILLQATSHYTDPDGLTAKAKLDAGYADFKNQRAVVKNRNKSSADRAQAARNINRNFLNNYDPPLNKIVDQTNDALLNSSVRIFLTAVAPVQLPNPEQRQALKDPVKAAVLLAPLIKQLNAVFPDRTDFVNSDPNQVKNLAAYLTKFFESPGN